MQRRADLLNNKSLVNNLIGLHAKLGIGDKTITLALLERKNNQQGSFLIFGSDAPDIDVSPQQK